MKKKYIVIIVVAVLLVWLGIVAVGIGIGKEVFSGINQENVLIEEANKIADMDLLKDKVDMEIKTKNEYAVIEKTMKDYFNDLAIHFQKLQDIYDEEQFNSILTTKNYREDGPNFKKTLVYLGDVKTRINDTINHLRSVISKEYVEGLIKNKNLDQYSLDLYYDIMLKDVGNSSFYQSQNDLKISQSQAETLLDTYNKTIDFLVDNQGYWVVDKDYIYFNTDELLEEYNQLILPLETKYY